MDETMKEQLAAAIGISILFLFYFFIGIYD